MDNKFIEDFCETFLMDHNIPMHVDSKQFYQLHENLVSEVKQAIHYLRENDRDFYEQIYSLNRTEQRQLLKEYLNMEYEVDNETGEPIYEYADPFSWTAIITYIITVFVSWGYLTRRGQKVLRKIQQFFGDIFDSLGKWIRGKGRKWKFPYAVIQKNAKKCYKKCGVDEKTLSQFTYAQVTTKPGPPWISTKKALEQALCLRTCYVDTLIEKIGLLSEMYFTCLKNEGQLDDIKNLRANDTRKLLAGLELKGACQEYFEDLKNAFDEFYTTLDLIYRDTERKDQQQKEKRMDELVNKILDVKKKVSRE